MNDLKTLVKSFYEPLMKDSELLARDDFNLIFSVRLGAWKICSFGPKTRFLTFPIDISPFRM